MNLLQSRMQIPMFLSSCRTFNFGWFMSCWSAYFYNGLMFGRDLDWNFLAPVVAVAQRS